MFARTHHALAPWTVVRADDKRAARLNIIRDLLIRQHYQGKEDSLLLPDPAVVFTYDVSYLEQGLIAP